jgi:uncharacterized membrane protein
MKSFLKYMPILLIIVLVIIAIGFIIRNFLTIVAGIVIVLTTYIFLTNKNFRGKVMGVFRNISQKCNDFYDENINDEKNDGK